MPHLSPSHAVPAAKGRGTGFLKRLGAPLSRLTRRVTAPWERRAAIRELERLDPRALCDVGIEPYEIEAVVDAMLAAERPED